MSNHGKESTNEEGVNIDETQTKIVMGKPITLWLKWSWNSDFTVALDHAFDDYWDTAFLEVLATLSTEVA
jgi:hypothetical protein